MRIPRRALCLWPGLPQLWLRGCWWGLAIALIFTALLNFQLAASWVWLTWVDPTVVTAGWIGVVLIWLAGVWSAKNLTLSTTSGTVSQQSVLMNASDGETKLLGQDRPLSDISKNDTSKNANGKISSSHTSASEGEILYCQAQQSYLRRDWLEAERLLDRLLQLDPLDVDAQLMLAAVYRLTNRPEQSRRALRFLDRMDSSGKWKWELRQEREKLNRKEQGGGSDQPDSFLEAA